MANDGWEDAPTATTSSSDGWEDAPKGASSLASSGWEDAPNQSDEETARLKRQGQKTTIAMSAKENPLVGGLEAAGGMLAGIPSQIAGGLGGLSSGIWDAARTGSLEQGMNTGSEVSKAIQESNFGFGQYQPQTETGKYYSDNLQKAFTYPGEKAGDLGAFLGKAIDPKYENLGRLTGQLPVDAAMNFIGPEMFHGGGKFLTRERVGKLDPVKAALDKIAADKVAPAKIEANPEKANQAAYTRAQQDGTAEGQRTFNEQDAGGNTSFHPDVPTEVDHTNQTELPFSNDTAHLGDGQQGDLFGDNQPAPRAEGTPEIPPNYGQAEQTTAAIRDQLNEQDARDQELATKKATIEAAYASRMADLPEEGRQEAAQRAKDIRDIQLGQLEQQLTSGAARPPAVTRRETRQMMRVPKDQRGSAPFINDLAGQIMSRTSDGLETRDPEGKLTGYLKSNLTPEQSKMLGENANIDIVKADKGQGIGSALYKQWASDHEGRVAPSGKTTQDAWNVWKKHFPEKVNDFVKQEAARLQNGGNRSAVLDNITDPSIRRQVVEQAQFNAPASQRGNAAFINDIADRWFKPMDHIQKQYGGKTFNNPITLKDGTRLSGFTDRTQAAFHGYDKNGERITMRSESVLPENIIFSKDSNKTAGMVQDALTNRITLVPKNQRGSAPIINDIAKGVEKLLGKADGRTPEEKALERATGLDTIGKGVSWASVKDSILGEKDGRELFTNLQSGLQHAADKVSSGLMSFTARHLAWADKTTNALNKSVVLPLERTLGTLTPKQMVRTMGVMRREMFQRQVFTPAELRSAGMSDKEINAYSRVREAFQDNLKMQNDSRAKLGQEPITPQAAYLASQWQGNWHLPVKDMEGRLVGYLKLDTKIEMNKAVDYLRKNMPDLDLKNPQIEYHGDKLGNKAPRDLLGAYQDVLKNLEDGDKVNAVREAIRAHIEDKAYTFQQHQQHFENKANIRFFQGDRPWLSDHANAYAQAKAQMSYLKESNKWAPLQEALANIKEAMSDKDLAASQPNNMRVTKAYVAKAMGLSTSAFKNIESYVAKQVGTYKALNLASKVVPTVHIMKEVTYLAQLGASGGYAIATPLQALLFGPSLHMRLSNQGYEHTALASTLKTAIDAPLAMNKATWDGMSKTGQAAMKYGEANGLIDMNIRDDNRSVGSGISNRAVGLREVGKAVDTAKNILNWTISAPEKVARTATFLSFVHHLDASGKYEGNREAMFQKAEDYTNHTLTDFSRQARPLAADKGGPIGELFYVYKSPIVNMWNNLSALAKDAQAGKGVMPFATALGMIAVLAGPMNMPLMNEYNDIMGYVKQIMARTTPGAYAASQKNPIAHTITSPKEVWIEQAQHVAAMGPGYRMLANTMTNGLPSATLGVNLSSRFGGNSVDLSGFLSNSAPLGQEIKEQAPAAQWLTNPNSTHATQWAYNNSPPAVQGAMENNMDAFGQDRANGSRTANQASDLEAHKLSYVRRPAEQVAPSEGLLPNVMGESGVRYGGMTSVAEANTKSTRAIINQKQMDSKAAQETSMQEMFDDIKNQRGTTAISRSAQNYVANGGDGETFQRDFSAVINASALTPEQRALMSTTSLQAINKIVLINKLMKH